MAFDVEGARKAGYSEGEIAGYLGEQSKFDVPGALKSGYSEAEVVSFLSDQKPAAPAEPQDLSKPAGVMGRDIKRVAAPPPSSGSVLEGKVLPEPTFDAQEATRLERRDYADANPLLTDPRGRAPSMRQGEGIQADTNADAGSRLNDAPFPVRAAAKAVTGGAQALGGAVRAVGDVTGVDAVSRFGANAAKNARSFEQGVGDAPALQDFGPNSPVPYLRKMGEGAASSLGQAVALGGAVGSKAVIPALSLMTAGQEYDNGRNAGLSPAQAIARAVPMGAFEAVGEKFAGFDKVTQALGTLMKSAGSVASKREASAVLLQAGVREVPGEVLTYMGQTGTDLLPGIGINQDLTVGQFLDGLRDTVVQSAMMGGAVGGAGVAVRNSAGPVQPTPSEMMRERGFGGTTRPIVQPAAIAQASTVDDAIATATAALDIDPTPVSNNKVATFPPSANNKVEAASTLSETPLSAAERILQLEGGVTPSPSATTDIQPSSEAASTPENATLEAASTPAIQPAPAPQRTYRELAPDELMAMTLDPNSPANAGAEREMRRRETEFSYTQRDQQKAAEEEALVAEARDQQAAQATATGVAQELDAPTPMQAAFAKATERQRLQAQKATAQTARAPVGPPVPEPAPAPLPNAQSQVLSPAAPIPPTENAQQIRDEARQAEQQRKAPGNRARAAAAEANPMRAFLARHGVAMAARRDFVPGNAEQRKAMVQGYGPIFRRTGLPLDQLAQRAVEEGFLVYPDIPKLEDMMSRSLNGERVIPQYAQGVAEAEMESRMERQRQLEEDAAEAVAALPDSVLFELDDDSDIPWDSIGSNASQADAMQALGFTQQEIDDASTTQPQRSRQDGEGSAQPVEADARQAQGDSGRGEGQAESAPTGLTSPTPAEVTAQQDRAAQGEREAASTRRQEEQRAQTDAEVGEFGLTGSDRPADANPNQDEIPFSRKSALGSSASQLRLVQRTADEITKGWANRPEVIVAASMNDAAIPQRVRDANEEQLANDAQGEPRAFIYGSKIYLIANQLRTDAAIREALYHEGLGHAGLRGVFGDTLNPMLREVVLTRRKDVARKAVQYGLDMTKESDRLQAAEEVLAELAESRPDMGVVRRAIAAIRAWLRANVPGFDNLRVTNDEILRRYILPARNFIERGRMDAEREGTPAFGRGDQSNDDGAFERDPATDTRAFHNFFSGSKVTDNAGNPLVVYHGTQKDFTTFDTQLTGSNLGAENRGFFFTSDPTQASAYAEDGEGANVMPAYVALKNPLIVDNAYLARNGYSPFGNGDDGLSFWREHRDELNAEIDAGGHDGVMIVDDSRIVDGEPTRTVMALRPNQVKSASGNRGTFNADRADIRFARGGNNLSTTGPQWESPEANRIDRMLYEGQDSRIDLKRVQEAIKESGAQIEERFDARTAETLYAGRVAYRSQEFLQAEVRPLLQAMALNKVSMNELADYLHARGAQERNEQIARVNTAMPDGGAGTNTQGTLMTTQAAKDYLSNVPAARATMLTSLAAKVDAITKGTRDLLVTEGLEKQGVVTAWEKAYKNYVPMFRDEADSGAPHPQGAGFSVRGGSSKRATGSTKEVTNILAHVLMQREAAVTRAEKNRVGVSLYGLALTNPNPEFWTTIRPGMQAAQIAADLVSMGVDPLIAEQGMAGVPTLRIVDPITNTVVDRPNPMYKSMPGAIVLKVAGEDRVLMLNQKDERALRMAEALKNMDGLTKFDLAGSIVGKTTRWLAAINTQFNPAFGLVNGIRDTFGGAINLTSTPLKGKSAQVLWDAYTKAGPGIAKAIMGKPGNDPWAALYKEFQTEGGQTGYREMFRDANERSKAIEKELKSLDSAGKLTPANAWNSVLGALDGFNTTIENAVRLSAYKTGIDSGMSKPAAAKLARELTVDFNRKGRAAREIGPLYAFFNASVQGSARTLEALRGPAGAKIIAGGLALGITQALLLAAAGFDDDEVPEFVKTRAFIIPMGGKKYIAVPLPLGLHVLPNTGRVITELAINGGKEAKKKAFNAVGEIAGSFSPLGGGNIFTADGALRTVLPSILDPVAELGFNKNFAGNQIERDARGETDIRPGFARAKESTLRSTTGQVYLGISKLVNKATLGSDYEAGGLSPTPERVQYLAQVAGGGLLRELEKTINLSTAAARGDKVPSSKIPIAGRLYGEVDDDAVQKSRYYEAGKRIDKAQAAFKAADKAGDEAELQRIADKYQAELNAAGDQDKISTKIAALNKLAISTVNDREKLKQIDEARKEEMVGLNTIIRKLEQDQMKEQNKPPTLAERLKSRSVARAATAEVAQ